MARPNQGDTVNVYEDPLSQTRLEGEATVLRVQFGDEEGGYYCTVRFSDGDVRDRWIHG